LLDVVDTVSDVLGTPLERMHVSARPGEVRHSQADPSRLHGLFPGVEPTDFAAALATTVTWFRPHPHDRGSAIPALARR
jgi:UDP-glucose 4-epimerase